MSSQDIRAILSLPPASSQSVSPSVPKKPKLPEGISREVYRLLGDNAPSLLAQGFLGDIVGQDLGSGSGGAGGKKFKERSWGKDKESESDERKAAQKWELQQFTPPTRSPADFSLSHWAKKPAATSMKPQESPFAPFSVQTPLLSYSLTEYETHLTDPDWTLHETDYLFSMLKEYDLRFIIVADRWNYIPPTPAPVVVQPPSLPVPNPTAAPVPSTLAHSTDPLIEDGTATLIDAPIPAAPALTPAPAPVPEPPTLAEPTPAPIPVPVPVVIQELAPKAKERPIEDLKNRYYSVCRRLIRSRPSAGDEASKTQTLGWYSFDREREISRRSYSSSLFTLTPEQIAEEETLYLECKRMEQTEKRFKSEREDLMRMLGGIESGLIPLPGAGPQINVSSTGTVPTGGVTDKKRKLEGGSVSSSPMGSDVMQNKKHMKALQTDTANCIVRPPPNLPPKLPLIPVFTRSSKIPIMKVNLADKIKELMGELEPPVNPIRLVYPSRANVEKLEGLIEAAGAMVELKRQVDRAEMEVRALKLRKEGGVVESPPVAPSSAPPVVAIAPAPGGPPSNAGGSDAVGGEKDRKKRSQSVLSVQSAGSQGGGSVKKQKIE